MLPAHNKKFHIVFANQHHATAVRVRPHDNAQDIMNLLGLAHAPAIFITGGAAYMTPEDIERTNEMIASIAAFAQENGITVIDGGTESGVMQMIGEARRSHNYTFPLIGIAPLGKISYPGYKNPEEEAFLEDSHTCFVLVDGDEWGIESEMLVSMTNAISNQRRLRACGVLINGGKIASQDVYLAVSKELPMLVLEGSGRFADEVATAFRTGKANQNILRAILAGGDIQLVSTIDGPPAMRQKLAERFLAAGTE